jgi:hypothetical protein
MVLCIDGAVAALLVSMRCAMSARYLAIKGLFKTKIYHTFVPPDHVGLLLFIL